MMDLSSLVKTDEAHPLAILAPVTNEPTGVTFMVRSADCAEVRAVARDYGNRALTSRSKVTADLMTQEAIDKVVACVASWDWGGNTWQGEKVGAFDAEKARSILSDPNASWIYEQVAGFASERANFTQRSKKG